jgi:hypothetical protein
MKRITTFVPLLLLAGALLTGCEETAQIRVENSVSGAVIKEVRWGSVSLYNSSLLPGEKSFFSTIYDSPSGGIDLPEGNPVGFVMNVQGDEIFLETRDTFHLDVDDQLTIVIDDTTRVRNTAIPD